MEIDATMAGGHARTPTLELLVVEGSRSGTRFVCEGRMVLGRRRECDIVFDPATDVRVSGRHASLELLDNAWRLDDLESRNGTFVNGRRLERPVALAAGDRIDLGRRGSRGCVSFVAVVDGVGAPDDGEPESDDGIRYRCGGCGEEVAAPISDVGRMRQCSSCGESTRVPLPRVAVVNRPSPDRRPEKSDAEPPSDHPFERMKRWAHGRQRQREQGRRVRELEELLPGLRREAREKCRLLGEAAHEHLDTDSMTVDEGTNLARTEAELREARATHERAIEEARESLEALRCDLADAVREEESRRETLESHRALLARLASDEASSEAEVRSGIDPVLHLFGEVATIAGEGRSALEAEPSRAKLDEVMATLRGLLDGGEMPGDEFDRSIVRWRESGLARAEASTTEAAHVGRLEQASEAAARIRQSIEGLEGSEPASVVEANRVVESIAARHAEVLARFGRAVATSHPDACASLTEYAPARASLDRLEEVKRELASLQEST